MTLKYYLTLYTLLKNNNLSSEENRLFALSSKLEKKDTLTQLKIWVYAHKNSLKKPLLTDNISSYIGSISSILIIFGFMFGFFSGIALLSYSGNAPVNVLYFIAIAIVLPIISMIISFWTMLRVRSLESRLLHISLSFWLDKILEFLSKKREPIDSIDINPLLLNSILIKRTQLVSLAFSIGIFLSLLCMVVTKDIAFSWSTTLHINPKDLHSMLNSLAFPWRDWLPQAVPSIELIEHSHYFRLGDKLSKDMIDNASILGEWWKFLAMATLVYSIFLRFIIYLFSIWNCKKSLVKSILTLDGVQKLLYEMNTPIITTKAKEKESRISEDIIEYDRVINESKVDDTTTLLWSFSKKEKVLLCDSLDIVCDIIYHVGGLNSFEEDEDIAKVSRDNVLFFVKAWEPPTMEFIDFLEFLCDNVKMVTLQPIGLMEDSYKPESKDIDIWVRKIAQFDFNKVWLKR